MRGPAIQVLFRDCAARPGFFAEKNFLSVVNKSKDSDGGYLKAVLLASVAP